MKMIITLLTFLFAVGSVQAQTMNLDSKIYVAGHNGLVGSAIVRRLEAEGFTNIITRTSAELDLTEQQAVNDFFAKEKPEYVFLAAAKVGGIKANSDFPAEFVYTNLMIEANVIHASYVTQVKKLLFLGSSCIYPRDCPQPIKESYLLTSALESSNKPYAVAKIAGIEMCQAYNRQYNTRFISCMPTNLYGPNDNFSLENAHVLPALLRKFVEAKENKAKNVEIWGTGTPRREFLHVDDLAQAAFFLMQNYEGDEIVNIGCGQDVTIAQLAQTIKTIVGYEGEIIFNTSKPDGTPQKLLDITKIQDLGWKPSIPLEEGIQRTFEWYLNHPNLKK